MGILEDVFDNMWIAGWPEGGVLGTEESIRRMTPEILKQHHYAHYVSDNLVLAVAGNTRGSKDEFKRRVDLWRRGVANQPHVVKRGRERRVTQETGYHNTHVMVGVPGLPRGDERLVILKCIRDILGGVGTDMSSSMLYDLNEKHDIDAYALETVKREFVGMGYLAVKMAVAPSQVREGIDMARNAMAGFARRVTESDLTIAIDKQMLALESLAKDQTEIALQAGEAVAFGEEYVPPHKEGELLKVVTLDKVRDLAKELFENVREDMGMAVVGRDKGNELE